MKESNFHANAGQTNQTIQIKENTMNAMSTMSELSNLHNSRTMSSREIAELTGKLHFNIMRDIKTLIDQGAFSGFKFEAAKYTDAQGKPRPEYLLDFDATMTLLIRYGMTYDAAKESLSKRGFKEKSVMENLPMNRSMNLGMNKTMSSREIAELTRKQHKHVLEDIRSLINQGAISEPDFRLAEYTDAQGKPRPEYLLDFDATMTLVTGYNAVLRAKVIRRWRELEEGVHNTQKVSSEPVQSPLLEELAVRGLKATYEMAKFFGLEGNQALLKADKAVKKLYNISPMALLEIELKSPDNEALLIATEIGKKLDPPISAKNVNLHLAAMGFQERVEYRTGKFEWRLTEKGKAYGSYLDTGKVHSNGTPIQQIKWKESIFPLVQKYLISLAH